MISTVTIRPNTYKDSVRLLEATRAMQDLDGVDYAWAVMATPANVETLAEEGFTDDLDGAGANDLALVVRAEDEETAEAAIRAADDELGAVEAGEADEQAPPVDLREARERLPGANLAIISVPGDYAALEAHKALTAGLDVLLFSDNVTVDAEIALKDRAADLGRLVMGPDAGTAMIAGTGLGFANRVRPGPVGIIAAAGTGAQEVMSLLDRFGVGSSHVIGLGGRDLSPEVGGRMARQAIAALDADPRTENLLLVSKPPSPEVAEEILSLSEKPLIASLIGISRPLDVPDHVTVCSTLEAGVLRVLEARGLARPDLVGDLDELIASEITGLDPDRVRLSGLFSGGTLCYEAMTIASEHIGPIRSNTPLRSEWGLPAPDDAHVCLDLGEEEYTRGRPHPMIDPAARVELLHEQAADPTVAVVLLDVVLGEGSHEDPAGVLVPPLREIRDSGAIPICHVLGTDQDTQGLAGQVETLREAGCLVTMTAARAALAASAVVLRDPTLVHEEL